MIRSFFFGLIIPLLIFKQVFAETSRTNKVEELIIWKISDELKLNVIEEKKFASLVRSLNDQKAEIESKGNRIIEQLKEVKAEKQKSSSSMSAEQLIRDYRKNILAGQKLLLDEVDQMQKLLGTQRLSQYLVLKFELNQKLRQLIQSGTVNKQAEQENRKLPPPKLIEDQ